MLGMRVCCMGRRAWNERLSRPQYPCNPSLHCQLCSGDWERGYRITQCDLWEQLHKSADSCVYQLSAPYCTGMSSVPGYYMYGQLSIHYSFSIPQQCSDLAQCGRPCHHIHSPCINCCQRVGSTVVGEASYPGFGLGVYRRLVAARTQHLTQTTDLCAQPSMHQRVGEEKPGQFVILPQT